MPSPFPYDTRENDCVKKGGNKLPLMCQVLWLKHKNDHPLGKHQCVKARGRSNQHNRPLKQASLAIGNKTIKHAARSYCGARAVV